MKAWQTAVAVVTTLVTAFSVAGSQPREVGTQAMLLTHGGRNSTGDVRFTLIGHSVSGLYPGATRQIQITVINPFGFPLLLHTLDARFTGTNRRACPVTRSTLRVSAYNGRLPITIKPYGRSNLPGAIPVTMPRDATPKCADTRLQISITGTGRRVGR